MSFHNMNEEDFGSDDSSDEDYVPCEGGNQVSEEENSGEDESLSLVGDDDDVDGKRGKKRKKIAIKRPKKQKVCKEEVPVVLKEDIKVVEVAIEDSTKKRADLLWADFLSDVGGPTNNGASSTKSTPSTPSIQKPEKITIVKEFDFAGETVKVSTEVDSNSKEAKDEKKKTTTLNDATQPITSSSSSSTPSSSTTSSSTPSSSSLSSSSFSPSAVNIEIKRPATTTGGGGLSGLLDRLNKKPKMTILEKSKLDWNSFKNNEGIDQELQQHNRGKNGYLERVAFLERSDYRQYEIERDMRLASRKPT